MSNVTFFSLLILCFFCVPAAATICAGVWERRLLQPFLIPAAGEEHTLTDPARLANAEAKTQGFIHSATFHDAKGEMYKVRYDFWTSQDRQIIAEIGSGTIAIIPTFGISLYSLTVDGLSLCTTNEIGEQDISGAEHQQTFRGKSFEQLLDLHRARARSVDLTPFPEDSPIRGYFDILRLKTNALVQKGLARYVDHHQTAWKFTFRGVITFYATASLIRPLLRGLRSMRLLRS